MEQNPTNRMARKRGRPPKYGPDSAQPVQVEHVPQPPAVGIRCPACGRSMVPRGRNLVQPTGCYASCALCGARLWLAFADQRISAVRVVG
jgi:hypothetical protein